jgi:NAD(P)-dependent dehydrogenase (short-subunit alcohol dehydrogenase family)
MTKNIKELLSLNGKYSLVTGGYGHLGAAISEGLAELGSNVIICGKRKEEGDKLASFLSKEYDVSVVFNEVDLNSKNSIDKLFENISNVDVLINNGFTWPTKVNFEETLWEDFEGTIQSGITSPFYVSKKSIEFMKLKNSGKIINIGSMYGIVSPNFKIYRDHPKMGNAIAYGASKAALIQMTKYLAVYCAKWNINVNCISPGPFPKPHTFDDKKWFEDELLEMNPLHKLGEPWELKGAVALFATNLASYITGQNLSIDGGWTIW